MLLLLDSERRVLVCPPDTARAVAESSTAPLAKDTEHILQARGRLMAKYVGKPRIKALLCVYAGQIQDLENALWQLATERTVSASIGVQLDGIGKIVGQERQGLSDTDYRPLLRARILANKSEGTAPDIIAIAKAALGGVGNVRFEFKPPAGYQLTISTPLTFDDRLMNSLIQAGTSAGVRGTTVLHQSLNGFLKLARTVSTFDGPTGLGSATSITTGAGQLARGMDEQAG